MARRCDLTGKRPNVANKVSHSNIKTSVSFQTFKSAFGTRKKIAL